MTRRKLLAFLAGGLLLLAAIDFHQRVYVPREYKARGEGSMTPAVVAAPQTPAQIQKSLSAWFPQLRPVAASGGATSEMQWALTLLAVFSDRDRSFAVVRATSASGGAPKVQSVAEGDRLYGLTVSRIEPLRLVLSGEGGEQELELFRSSTGPAVGSGASASSQVASPAAQGSGPAALPQADPKAVASQGWKPGAPAQLPSSMQGLPVAEAPATTKPPEIRKGRKIKRPPKAPGNP